MKELETGRQASRPASPVQEPWTARGVGPKGAPAFRGPARAPGRDWPDGPLEIDITLALDPFELVVQLDIGGGVTGIFGPSGAGKSSLLETVAGLRRQATGRVVFRDVELGEQVWLDTERRIFMAPQHRGIGYVPQEGLLFPHWDVRRNLLAGEVRARQHGSCPEDTLPGVVDLLQLGPLLDRLPATLSGGERQRVALGRALCSGPRLLLLDEPLAALDLPLRRKLLPFLRRIRDELTVPMLLISHDPNEVQALCDDLVVLRQGKVLTRGTPRQVLTDPAVYALATDEGFENVLSGRVVSSDDGVSMVHLGESAGDEDGGDADVRLVVLGSAVPGSQVLVGLPASEVILATERPRGLSARNLLPARIRHLRQLDQHVLVSADMGGGLPPLMVEITKATPGELGLEVGGRVFLVIKAASCRIYGAER